MHHGEMLLMGRDRKEDTTHLYSVVVRVSHKGCFGVQSTDPKRMLQ